MNIVTEPDSRARTTGPFLADINGIAVSFTDPTPTSRQMLDKVGYVPASDSVLIQVLSHGTQSIGLDEVVDLRTAGVKTFWAFKTDRIFRFTVDEHGFEWGAPVIKEPILREVAHTFEDAVLVLERRDQPDQVLSPDDEVRLAEEGTEHLRTEKRLVEVFFKDLPYLIPRGTYTTEQLMAKFPIEAGYLLNLKKPDGELVTLKPGQETHVKAGMHFYSQVPGGGSS